MPHGDPSDYNDLYKVIPASKFVRKQILYWADIYGMMVLKRMQGPWNKELEESKVCFGCIHYKERRKMLLAQLLHVIVLYIIFVSELSVT